MEPKTIDIEAVWSSFEKLKADNNSELRRLNSMTRHYPYMKYNLVSAIWTVGSALSVSKFDVVLTIDETKTGLRRKIAKYVTNYSNASHTSIIAQQHRRKNTHKYPQLCGY